MNTLVSKFIFICISFSFISGPLFGQKAKKEDKHILSRLKTHIAYLADDRLEGRRAGSNGEKLAMEYIAGQFRDIGLQEKGTAGYYQPFEISEGNIIGETTRFVINDSVLQSGRDFFPFAFSAEKELKASPSIALQEPEMPWFFDLKDALEENKNNPHFDIETYIKTNATKAQGRGATAIILYNSSDIGDNLKYNSKDHSEKLKLPVVYVTKEAALKYFGDATATLELELKVAFAEKKRTGHNVIGYIDNGATTTVILGAHFDHLGYGEDGNSMLRTGEPLIHNGADDNASGTSALIELARLLKSGKSKNNNYLFAAFSGEELGLFGSKYFTENATIDLNAANYMINMDMVGRLNDSTKTVAIGGFGTSPQWATVINPLNKKNPFLIKLDSSGSGPSDHTSFYRKDIPVLFFFTGQHRDYHRPSDDADRINYEGEVKIIQYIHALINNLNKQNQKLAFLKTRETQSATTSFRVTLGIMPDYTYNGNGVRADGVTEGRPASKAGIKPGDVIIRLGDHVVNSVETYMQALNKFTKGQKTTVAYRRGDQTHESEIQF
jgi:aminopeptidase YwaD